MPRPPKVSTQRILEVAKDQFLSKGPGVSLHSIAESLTISHSALLQRFGSKQQLLCFALQIERNIPWSDRFLLGPSLNHKNTRDEFVRMCLTFEKFAANNIPKLRVLKMAGMSRSELFGHEPPFVLKAIQEVSQWVNRGISRGVFSCSNVHIWSNALIGSLLAHSQLLEYTATSSEVEFIGHKISKDEHVYINNLEDMITLFYNQLKQA